MQMMTVYLISGESLGSQANKFATLQMHSLMLKQPTSLVLSLHNGQMYSTAKLEYYPCLNKELSTGI